MADNFIATNLSESFSCLFSKKEKTDLHDILFLQ